MVVAILISTVLIALAALAIDLGFGFTTKAQVSKAADAGALAGAADLPNHTTATADATSYAQSNAGSGASVTVTFPNSTQISVTVCKTTNTLFGGIIGHDTITSCSAAKAAKVQTFGVSPLFFVKGGDCDALKISGGNSSFQGDVITNGGIDESGSGNSGGSLTYSTTDPHCYKPKSPVHWSPVTQGPANTDWPIAPPTITFDTAGHPVVDGMPCIYMGDKWTPDAAPTLYPPGIYCATSQINISKQNAFAGMAFVAPQIQISASNIVLTPYAGLSQYCGGLLLDAYGSGGLNLSGGSDLWSGGVFAPVANAHVSGSNGQVITGCVEADTIQISGSGVTWQAATSSSASTSSVRLIG